MANPLDTIENRLDQVDAHVQRVLHAATQVVRRPQETEVWWPHLVGLYGSPNAIFVGLRIDRGLFVDALALVRDIHANGVERRGRSDPTGRSSCSS